MDERSFGLKYPLFHRSRGVPPVIGPDPTIIPAKRPFADVRDIRYEPLGAPGFDILELLLEDRRKR